MPQLTIKNIDGDVVTVSSEEELMTEIMLFENEIDALEAALDGDDDTAGNAAMVEYRKLSRQHAAIVSQLPAWNAAVLQENRLARQAVAAEIRERRQNGGAVKRVENPTDDRSKT